MCEEVLPSFLSLFLAIESVIVKFIDYLIPDKVLLYVSPAACRFLESSDRTSLEKLGQQSWK